MCLFFRQVTSFSKKYHCLYASSRHNCYTIIYKIHRLTTRPQSATVWFDVIKRVILANFFLLNISIFFVNSGSIKTIFNCHEAVGNQLFLVTRDE